MSRSDASEVRDHAVVLGAGIAGLCTAAVLTRHFNRVTLVERDHITAKSMDGKARRGVPQGPHIHLVLSRAAQQMEQLFPGLIQQCLADGALDSELGSESRITYHGHTILPIPSGIDAILASRPFLESHLRTLTLRLPTLALRENVQVTGLITTGGQGATTVRGVRVHPRGGDVGGDAGGDAGGDVGGDVVEADLVVDAMGRGARSGVWLKEMGYERAPEERTRTDVTYASRHFALPHEILGTDRAVVIGATSSQPRGMVFAAQENATWVLSLQIYGDHKAPATDAEFLASAATVAPPDIMRHLQTAEPLDPIAVYRFPCGIRRRYDQLRRFPGGLLAIGDALCSVNPVYGSGISLAAAEAIALGECLAEESAEPLARRFFRTAHRTAYPTWWLAKCGDYSISRAGPGAKLLGSCFRLLSAAAADDPKTATAMLRSLALVDSPSKLVRPRILQQMIRSRLRS
ncbi:FAD-dependent oxidoreductase [Streptomyces sp. NPDC055078]